VGRLEWYLKEAVPIFILGTLVLFFLDTAGVLERIVTASEPGVVGILQLPPKAAEAFLIGFFRRDYGSAGIYALFQQGHLSPVQAVVALVTITLFVHASRTSSSSSKSAAWAPHWRCPLSSSLRVPGRGVINFTLRAVGLQ